MSVYFPPASRYRAKPVAIVEDEGPKTTQELIEKLVSQASEDEKGERLTKKFINDIFMDRLIKCGNLNIKKENIENSRLWKQIYVERTIENAVQKQ